MGVDLCRVVGVDQVTAVVQMTGVHQGMEVGVDHSMKVHRGMVAGGCWCLEMGVHQGKGIGLDIVQGLANFCVVLVEPRYLVVVVVVVAPVGLQRHCSMRLQLVLFSPELDGKPLMLVC